MIGNQQDASDIHLLEKLSGFEIRNIAERAISLAGASGMALLAFNQQFKASRVIFYLADGRAEAVEAFEFSLTNYDYLTTSPMEISSFSINGNDLLTTHQCIARQLHTSAGTPIGCLVLLQDVGSEISAVALPAMDVAADRIILAVERLHTSSCPVLGTNSLLNQKLDLLNEIGSISKTGGWEIELSSGAITWTDEMYVLYRLPTGTKITVGLSMSYFPSATRKAIQQLFDRVVNEGEEYCYEGFLHRADGSIIRVKATGKPRYQGKRVTHVYGALEDITDQYRLLETEYNYTSYLAAILDNLNDVVVTIDTSGTIITANKTMSTIFGYEPEEVLGCDVNMLMPEPYAKYHSDFLKHYLETGRAKIIGVGRELPGLHKSGRVFPIELSLSEVIQDGQRQFIGIVKDITERKKAMEEIYQTAYFDSLTKLPNMRSFEMDVAKVLKQASSQFRALDIYCCIIDIDNFTQYNLSFGKRVGDQILKVISARLVNVVTDDLSVYRGIGDNFMILSTVPIDGNCKDSEDAIDALEWALHKAIVAPISIDELSHSLTAAISSCRLEASKASYEKIDGVLSFGKKRAKRQGPGTVLTLDNAAFDDYNRYNIIRHSFKKALVKNEFYLMLQPQVDAFGDVVGSEALIRWDHAELGMISPVEFIPIAEESDAIIDIGNWVINEACRLLNACKEKGKQTRIAINISGRHIVRADFPETLTRAIEKWQLTPESLMLEITETTLVSSIDLVRQRMEELGLRGFSFSIDDFGTGYSSLSYLKELPISELKIDRYFVDEITFSDDEVPIVNSIIDLAHALSVSTVAEGIESDFQLDYLRQRGCQFFQGYFFSRPLPEKAWLDYIDGASLVELG